MAEALIIGTLIGSTLLSAGSAVVSGVQSNNAAKVQASQYNLQLEAEKTQAAVESEQRQRQLKTILASQNAIFGGSNVDMSTGTPSIIAGDTYNNAMRQQNQSLLYSGARQSVLQSSIDDAKLSGRISLTRGYMGAAQSLINGASQLASVGKPPTAAPAVLHAHGG